MEDKFTWTQEYKKSWEEDSVKPEYSFTSPKHRDYNPNRKNVIRHLLVAIDTSSSIEKQDYLPTIRNQITNSLSEFSTKFISMNPLSLLTFMTCNNTFQKFAKSFDPSNLLNVIGDGEFSLLNCLSTAVEILKNSGYARECLIITASIGTKDSSSFDEIFKEIKKYNIKVNIISISGEVTLFKRICAFSCSSFYVPQCSNDFEYILSSFLSPLESLEATNTLIKFGFPTLLDESGVCTCHLTLNKVNYECPNCKTRVCSLPIQCPVCDLRLISPLNIAKSYYYMYPLAPLKKSSGICDVCKNTASNCCTKCNSSYCQECHSFIENDLNFCLFCD